MPISSDLDSLSHMISMAQVSPRSHFDELMCEFGICQLGHCGWKYLMGLCKPSISLHHSKSLLHSFKKTSSCHFNLTNVKFGLIPVHRSNVFQNNFIICGQGCPRFRHIFTQAAHKETFGTLCPAMIDKIPSGPRGGLRGGKQARSGRPRVLMIEAQHTSNPFLIWVR